MNPTVLKHCQVSTPLDIVKLMWQMTRARRPVIKSVLDLGAGDGRFSAGANDASYVGYEIDLDKIKTLREPRRQYFNRDVLDCERSNFQVCIGNPPYIRKELIDTTWRNRAIGLLSAKSGGIKPRADANAFVYFLWLALILTARHGIVVQLVPFEWVSRPSAAPLRDFIKKNRWNVDVFRFSEDIFDRVLTTAAIVIIDKSKSDGSWRYFTLDRDGREILTANPTGSDAVALDYSTRGDSAFALRGLSPGGQDVYVLTEEARRFQGLAIGTDVSPCITTLRHLEADQLALTPKLFDQEFVKAGRPCWLIRSDREKHSRALNLYLDSVKHLAKKYTTNTIRGEDWFRYRPHPIPDIVVASGFRTTSPKTFLNQAGVVTLGSVYAVFVRDRTRRSAAVRALREFDFSSQVVAHSNGLKKIEVKQLNAVLSKIVVV